MPWEESVALAGVPYFWITHHLETNAHGRTTLDMFAVGCFYRCRGIVRANGRQA